MDRRAVTDELRRVLPASPEWDLWLDASGELAPDFDELPSRPAPWPPHEGLAGPGRWPARAEEVRARLQRWVLGTMPPPDRPEPPVELELLGGGPGAPAFVVAHPHEPWAQAAADDGWCGVVVHAGDGSDGTDRFDPVAELDWAQLTRRAWALNRALDRLERDHAGRCDPSRAVLAGHSRNGKAALIAAAFDPRWAGVVSSSSGVLGAMPLRRLADPEFGEGAELLTRMFPRWFHPRLRFFAGREDRLPTDAHELLACVAPRPVLLSVAVQDQVESAAAAREVHGLLREHHRWLTGRPGGPTLLWRTGGHSAEADALAAHLAWARRVVDGGPLPAVATVPRGPALLRPPAPASVERRTRTLPSGVAVDLHVPRGVPVTGLVLWSAPLCRATGWQAGYEHAEPLHETLTRSGVAVACWDPPGCGERVQGPDLPLPAAAREAAAVLALARAELPDVPAAVAGYGHGADVALALGALEDGGSLAGIAAAAPDSRTAAGLLGRLAGRDVLVVLPRWGRGDEPERLRAAVEAARGPALDVAEPDDFRFGTPARTAVIEWLRPRVGAD